VIGVYDLHHKIIPDVFSYLFAGLALIYVCYTSFTGGPFQWGGLGLDVLAGPLYFLPFAGMWYFSKGTWMGFGDAKLALGIGWFLGLEYTYIAMMISFWVGALVGLSLIVYGKMTHRAKDKTMTMKSEIPFGPFLIFGVLVMVFFGPLVENVLSLFLFK
jgi:leader peptidase (prepilin peptidase)/N-methyltransferase